MRVILSLFVLISAFTLFTMTGCGNTDFPIEEGKTMSESVNPIPETIITGGYKTATFALG